MNVLENKEILVLQVASYLYAMRYLELDSSKTPQQCMDSFVTMYLEKQECHVEVYLETAKSILNLDKFDVFLKSIDIMRTAHKLTGFSLGRPF